MKKLYLGLAMWLFVVPIFAQDTNSEKNNSTNNQEEPISSGLVKGSVKGADDEPLVGATIIIKGTTNGTTADADGHFRLEATKGDVLVASYIGTFTSEITYTGQAQIDFVLQTDIASLEEIIVVGYGTQKKADITGAISVVDMDELNKRQVATIDEALQGQVAGVDVTSSSGTPGGGIMIRIRGTGTLNDSSPLFVVDGLMVNDINFVNPNDIESMQVLKDASATAIYGSRGSNGVVIITTKKGEEGKTQIQLSTYAGVQNFWRSTNVLDANTWGQLRNEAMVAAGNPAPIANPENLENTNWFNEIQNENAAIYSLNLSISGANKKGNYFISANKFSQDGIIKKTNFERLSFRINSSFNVKPWLKVGENINIAKSTTQRGVEQDEWTSMVITSIAKDPASPVRNDDGTFAAGTYNDTWNPAAIIEYTNNDDVVYRTIGNVFADITLTEGLTFRSSYSLEYSFGETDSYRPVYYVSSVQQNVISNYSKNNSSRFIGQWSNTLSYAKTVGDHAFDALLGYESYSSNYQYNGISVNDIPSDNIDVRYIDNATGSNAATVWGSINQVRQLSALGRVNYSFKDKYLLTANFRADASSKFAKKNRWGYFPSFSAGWRISDESFFSSVSVINNLKFRVGWGLIGNQGSVPPYQNVTTSSAGANYLWGGVLAAGSSFPGSGNDEIQWETSGTTNFGLDFGFFEGKLSGTAEYYIKNTTGMLLQVPIPSQAGLQNPPTLNAGEMRNTGLELSLLYRNNDNKLRYSFGGNFSKINNEVVDLGADDAFIDGALFMNSFNVTRTTAGRPIAQFYGYKTDGLFQNQAEIDAQTAQQNVAPGDVRYVDADNDGELDFEYLGSPLPSFTYAFNASLGYAGFDLSIQIQGVHGNQIFNGTSFYKRSSTANWNLGRDMVNRWTGEGSQNDARYPRMNAADVNNSLMSDRYIEDGSYMRIKNLQLGYNISTSFLSKLKLSQARVYINAQNLLTFTKYSGLDPEIGMNGFSALDLGVDRGFYPQARIFSAGLTATF